jgi:hypothetical protein
MDIGDIVIFGGKRYRISGFDPAGVEPRFVYLDDVETGQRVSLALEALSPLQRPPRERFEGDVERRHENE